MSERVSVKIPAEEAHFAKVDAERIKRLREDEKQRSDETYREKHRYHCFRCGTQSLVEVTKGPVVVDICVNEGCGAVHLDGGELDQIAENGDFIKSSCRKLADIFKR
ncbi:MAG: zf-TFIIB domain-containing protein [Magnetococcales bacterium]|nr:zf-TFIIB domain-containing protein [Magnetococcales bacterium]